MQEKINVGKSRQKLKKSIENKKMLQYYKYNKNLKKSKKETQNMKKAKTFAGVEREREREREREPQH